MHRDYEYRVAHIDARPPHTYAAALRIDVGAPGVRFTLAVPIAHVAAARRGDAVRTPQRRTARAVRPAPSTNSDRSKMSAGTLEIRANTQARASGGQPVRMNSHQCDDHLAADDQRGGTRRNRPDDGSRRIHPADRHGKIPQVGHFRQGPRPARAREGSGRPITPPAETTRRDAIPRWRVRGAGGCQNRRKSHAKRRITTWGVWGNYRGIVCPISPERAIGQKKLCLRAGFFCPSGTSARSHAFRSLTPPRRAGKIEVCHLSPRRALLVGRIFGLQICRAVSPHTGKGCHS